MARPDAPIAQCDNGSVQHSLHEDHVLVSFTDSTKKDKPRNHTLVEVPELVAKYEAIDDDRAAAQEKHQEAVAKANDALAEIEKELAKRRATINAEAFSLARKQLTKIEKQAAKVAAAAAAVTDGED